MRMSDGKFSSVEPHNFVKIRSFELIKVERYPYKSVFVFMKACYGYSFEKKRSAVKIPKEDKLDT